MLWGVVTAVIALSDLTWYIVIARTQDPPPEASVFAGVSLIILTLAGAALVAAASRRERRALLTVAAIGLAIMGVAGIFSIGLPLLLAAVLAAIGAVTAKPES